MGTHFLLAALRAVARLLTGRPFPAPMTRDRAVLHDRPVSLQQQMQLRRKAMLGRMIERIRPHAELALFAAAFVMATAFAATLREMPEARASNERVEILEIAEENRAFCAARGLPAGGREHTLCVMELNQLRAKHAQRVLQPVGF